MPISAITYVGKPSPILLPFLISTLLILNTILLFTFIFCENDQFGHLPECSIPTFFFTNIIYYFFCENRTVGWCSRKSDFVHNGKIVGIVTNVRNFFCIKACGSKYFGQQRLLILYILV